MKGLVAGVLLCSMLLAAPAIAPVWATNGSNRYAVVGTWINDTLDTRLANLGVKWIRTGFDWDTLETADNYYDPGAVSGMDTVVNEALACGVNVFHNFNYTPAWARPGGTTNATPPTNPAKYTEHINWCVNRYKDRVKFWGFWNEPNLSMFYNGTLDGYIHNLLLPGIDAVKAADPSAHCVVGELSTSGDDVGKLRTILQELTAHGKKDMVDIICHHSYDGGDTASGRIADIDTLRNMIVSEGYGGKDFWITESGLDTPNTTTQANYVVGMITGMDARPWWKRFFYWQMHEGPGDNFGLVDYPTWDPKPAYNSYQSYISNHANDQAPFLNAGVAWAIPGTIQAENYDEGLDGAAYHDNDNVNSGQAWRTEGVDIEACSEGGYNIGWMSTGEWLEWTVNVASAGNYNFNVRVASPNSGRTFHIEMNGNNVTGTKTVTNTGGWQNWATVTAAATLNAGTQIMRLYVDSGDWNLNYIQVSSVGGTNHAAYISDTIPSAMIAGQTYNCTITMQNDGSTTWTNGSGPADYNFGPWDAPPGPNINWASRVDVGSNIAPGQQKTFNLSITPPSGTSPGQYNTTWGMVQETVQWFQNMVTKPITISSAGQTPYAGVISLPGTIQAENFDNGGEGVAYHDTSGGNAGGQYRSTDVDIETTSDTGGGYNVGWIDSGEWLEWTVNVASSGDYDFYVRVASPNTGNAFQIKIDNNDITGTRVFDSTGGWQNWTTIIVPSRYMTSGQHILQFYVVSGGFNFNKIDVYSRGLDAISCDLGSPEFLDGMTHIQVSDGDTVAWSSAGHRCRENVDYPDTYMYFGVADNWAYHGSKQNVKITFDYYDLGTNRLDLNYDSVSGGAYKVVTGPTLTNTGTFKQYTWTLTDAYFGNRQNGGADFRISVSGQQEWGIDTVCVYQ